MKPGEGGLILLRSWRRPGRALWLGLDLAGGEKIHEVEDPADPGPDLAGSILLINDTSPRLLGDGATLLAPEGLLWSLVDPLGAGFDPAPAGIERHEVEAHLRRLRVRFRERLSWWRPQQAAEGAALGGLLGGFRPDLTPLLAWLDRVPPAVEGLPSGSQPEVMAAGQGVPLPALDPDAVRRWLASAEGLGSVYGAGFAARQEQAEMGREVAASLAGRRALLIESGTGVGKTLAYLIPLLAGVVQKECRAVVATGTRALQTQILEQDLPRLRPLLGGARCALLMGRRNYLCLRQRRAFLSRPCEDLEAAMARAAFRMWLRATEAGMREELQGHPLLQPFLPELFDAPEPCLPGDCYEGSGCYVQGARRKARSADLLIVNHSLLLNDLKMGRTILGEYDLLVVDEAHRLPQVALDTHSLACGRWRMEEIGEMLGGWGSAGGLPLRPVLLEGRLRGMGSGGRAVAEAALNLAREVRDCRPLFQAWWSAVGTDLEPLLQGADRQRGRRRIQDKADTFRSALPAAGSLQEQLAAAVVAGSSFLAQAGALEDLPPPIQDGLALLGQACQLLDKLQVDIHFLMRDPDDRWVTWCDPTARGGLKLLGATLVESGELLREYWLGCDLAPVMTSATLAVGEDFSYMLTELGLTRRRPPAATHSTASPFDYHRQVLVLTPERFLAPDAGGFGREVGEVLAALAREVGRKTLGLFTSYRHLAQAYEVMEEAGLRPPESEHRPGHPVLLRQVPGVTAAPLASDFRRHRHAVLLGTTSFWEGVDFPGADLEVLVVAKLPFLVPADPWVQARCELTAARGENPFRDFMVRDAVLRLKQGFGRLIRRPQDRGVVVILDRRLHTKSYGATFLSSMPVMPRTFGDQQEMIARITEFFQQAEDPGQGAAFPDLHRGAPATGQE